MLRPYASPLPLSLLAFAVGMLMLAGMGLGWIPNSQSTALAVLIAAFVAPLQFLSTILALLSRDAGAAALLGLLAALSCARAVLQGVWELGAGQEGHRADGAVALAVFALGVYLGAAFLVEDLRPGIPLPIGRVSAGRRPVLPGEVEPITAPAAEPAVREQL